MTTHLGPRLARRPMHVFWLLDVSGSMGVDGKIEALNDAMREAVAAVRDAAAENPGVEVLARVITFAHDATWHLGDPVPIEELEWTDVAVVEGGTTEVGRAVALATEAIHEASTSGRGLPPAIVLVSDGRPTDLKAPSLGASLRALAEEPWGRKASRIAIGIGRDADAEALRRFIGHDELEPLLAGSASELRHYLRWASTVVVDERSRPTPPRADTAIDPRAAVTTPPPESVTPAAPPPPPGPATNGGTGPDVPDAGARIDLPPPPGAVPPPPPPASDGPQW